MVFSMFPRLKHLTYDPWTWLKVTSMASKASVMKDDRISLEIPSFYSKKKIFKISKWGDSSHKLTNFKSISGSEYLNGLNDLTRCDNITGLNDLNSLCGLKKIKRLVLYILSDITGIRILSSLNDLRSLHSPSGLNDPHSLITSKNLLNWCFHQS